MRVSSVALGRAVGLIAGIAAQGDPAQVQIVQVAFLFKKLRFSQPFSANQNVRFL
jgi:hypothetical protein